MIFGFNFLSDMSLAMLSVRSERDKLSNSELFVATINAFKDKEGLSKLKLLSLESASNKATDEWDEDYVNNFMLNRFCNLRISDNTIHLADKMGYNNEKMKENLSERIILLFPTPLLNLFGVNVDKNNLFSQGDFLFSMATKTNLFPGYRVTSYIGDGLATFGYWYYFIHFILFYIFFLLLDCFMIFDGKRIVFSVFGILSVFTFLGYTRNANGISDLISFVLRGFIQSCFIFIIIINGTRLFYRKKIKRLYFK